MEDFVVSAPGKVILHGEHAVVYGKVALAAALDLRTYLRIRKKNDGRISVSLPNINIKKSWDIKELKEKFQLPLCDPLKPIAFSDDLLNKLKDIGGIDNNSSETTDLAVIAFLYLFLSIAVIEGDIKCVEVTVSSNLPISAGLGSSAGYSVCLASGLLQLSGIIMPKNNNENIWSKEDKTLINAWAFQGEKVIHGNPSGIDNSISTFGGAIRFQSGKITPIEKMPKLRILLVNTKVPRSTKILVAGVRDRYNKLPNVMQPILDSMEAIGVKCQSVLGEITDHPLPEHYKILEDLIDINQHLLEAIGVSHPSLSNIRFLTCQSGLHSKLTGAGGGGCSFTLIPPDTQDNQILNIKKELLKAGYDSWETSAGANGVTNHSVDHTEIPQDL